ncbi:Sad1 / UNC-like C-terminal domain containing protein [Rhypophila decipiens]
MRYREYTAWGRRACYILLLGLDVVLGSASPAAQETSTSTTGSPPTSTTQEVCESRTVNYITHTLPQQCLKTAWTSSAPTDGQREGITATGTDAGPTPSITVAVEASSTAVPVPGQEEAPNNQSQGEDGAEGEDMTTTTFMSFEEWKEMMLRKSGDPANIKGRKPNEHRESKVERDAAGMANDLDSLGDDAEISLDFDALSEKVSEITAPAAGSPAVPTTETRKEEQVLQGDGVAQYYRSKDAGKTCKERFSYSSFDAGATILKTSPGAKNAKAILVENKDSYMLLECRSKNKFVIVELSDDILVDTVVLANFEFFSSMIRTFKVSVSDRYPGKWLDLGTFEARNSRDIQPFLVEHPQIYTKYIRIEFLTHYGNEHYCPVSLLRVHGTRLLDGWKDPPEQEEPEQIEAPPQEAEKVETGQGSGSTESTQEEARPSSVAKENATETWVMPEPDWTPWDPLIHFSLSPGTCASRSPTTGEPTPVSTGQDQVGRADAPGGGQSSGETGAHETARPSTPIVVIVSQVPPTPHARATDPSAPAAAPDSSSPQSSGGASQKVSQVRGETVETPQTPPSAKAAKPSTGTPTTSRNKTTAASGAASASPTVQESFFKSVTKRLQALESNTTLSLQYIEQQSRFLQEVLLTIEKKQINRVDSFLNTLNKTVLTELRNVRTQYDQIWQSTVIALETQRDQSEREIVALSTRLNVLAEEVVFQKRMAILQSVLLLSCLVLVIFSRGLGGPSSTIDSNNPNLMSPSPPQRRGARFMTYDFNNSPSPPATLRSRGSDTSTGAGRYYFSDKALPMTPASPDFPIKEGEDGVNVIITPASPQYAEDDRHHPSFEETLITPPSSRAISEEPIVPVSKAEDTPKAPQPPPAVRDTKASSPIQEEPDEYDEDEESSTPSHTPESLPSSFRGYHQQVRGGPRDDDDEDDGKRRGINNKPTPRNPTTMTTTTITTATKNMNVTSPSSSSSSSTTKNTTSAASANNNTVSTPTRTSHTTTTTPNTTPRSSSKKKRRRNSQGNNSSNGSPEETRQAANKGGGGGSANGKKPLPALLEDS